MAMFYYSMSVRHNNHINKNIVLNFDCISSSASVQQT